MLAAVNALSIKDFPAFDILIVSRTNKNLYHSGCTILQILRWLCLTALKKVLIVKYNGPLHHVIVQLSSTPSSASFNKG